MVTHAFRSWLWALGAILLATPVSNAAFITINDSNLTSMTITAGDFEGGFFINGNLLTSGLGNSASITLPDAGYTYTGTWIDLGAIVGTQRIDVLFAFPATPTDVTSGFEGAATSDGTNATLSGSFGGFTGITYFNTGLTTNDQNGPPVNSSLPFLSFVFIPEAAPSVPEPATLVLLGTAAPVLALGLRRRRKAQTASEIHSRA